MARSSNGIPIMARKLEAVNKGIKKAKSRQTKERISRKTFEIVRQTVYDRVDARARSNHAAYHHLYEWGQTGDPDARLFKITSSGRGKASFEVSYDFLKSGTPVPNEEGGSEHVFAQKARVMESGQAVTIAPVNAQALKFRVKDGTLIYTAATITVPEPGGAATTGTLRSDFMQLTRPSSIARNPLMKQMFEYEGRKILDEVRKAK